MLPSSLIPVVGAAGGASVMLFVYGLRLRRTEQPVPQALTDLDAAATTKPKIGPVTAVANRIGTPLKPTLAQLLGERGIAGARRMINSAGRPKGMTVDSFLQNTAGLITLFGLIGILLAFGGHPLLAVIVFVLGSATGPFALWQAGRKRQEQIQRGLPDFLDVLAVTVAAGLGFRHALARVAESMPGPFSEEVFITLRQMELGTPRREAFEQLRERNSSTALTSFVTALLQAEELGAPLSQALIEIGKDMRRESAQYSRRLAQRCEPRITVVTTFLMVPGLMILVIGTLLFSGDTSGLSGG